MLMRSFGEAPSFHNEASPQMPQFSATGLSPYSVSPYVRDYQSSSSSSRDVIPLQYFSQTPPCVKAKLQKLTRNRQHLQSPPNGVGPQALSSTQDWLFPTMDMQNEPASGSLQPSPQSQTPGSSPARSSYNSSSQSNTQLASQLRTPSPILVQLGASQNYLINSQPAPYIKVLDIDPTYRSSGPSSPSASPCE